MKHGSLIESSREIVNRAIAEYKPYAIGLMLSGGDDSMTALHVSHELGVKLDFIMHGVTGTGIKETHDFVLSVVSKEKAQYIEAHAGTTYEDYVLRKGFMGVGQKAHEFSYHLLKWTAFRREVSKQIRHKKRNRNILFLNGGRRMESDNRLKTFVNPINARQAPNIWVNIINEWPDNRTSDYLEANGVDRNPVSKLICRSGECNCGTQLKPGDAVEIGYHYPAWRKWVDSLEAEVKKRGFSWGWAESMPKGIAMEKRGQMNMFQPMCQSCVIQYATINGTQQLSPTTK